MQKFRTSAAFEKWPLFLLGAFLVLALFTGGGSRPDVQSHLVLRPAAVLLIMVTLVFAARQQIRLLAVPLSFLFALAAIMVIQLVPLPPSLWTTLPGREIYIPIAGIAGIEQPWRPISLAPVRTWNSLISLLPPLAALLAFALVRPRLRQWILLLLILLIFLSAVLGMAQIMGPPKGALYLYRITNNGSAVGFFANRNHQAMLLACLFPMLALFASAPAESLGSERFRLWTSLGIGLMLVPLLLVTGSRAGLGLAILGLILSWALYQRPQHKERLGGGAGLPPWKRKQLIAIVGGVGAVAVVVGATLYVSKADAIYRLFDANATELRFQLIPSLVQLASSAFPVGTGFGSFEYVYRGVEPYDLLQRGYVNHAHNDLIQIVIEGGLAGAILVLAFVGWWLLRSFQVWRAPAFKSRSIRMGRLGSVVILILLLGSIVDYPLRTPFLMIIFALACAWLELSRQRSAAIDADQLSA